MKDETLPAGLIRNIEGNVIDSQTKMVLEKCESCDDYYSPDEIYPTEFGCLCIDCQKLYDSLDKIKPTSTEEFTVKANLICV
ncbi:hypothetical protein GCM10028807_63030 [Spirosoma daeguense]